MVAKILAAGIAIALAAVAVLAVPAIRHLRETRPAPPPPIRLTLSAPSGSELGSADEILDAAISPTEREIVFVATSDGVTRLWRRGLDRDTAEPVAGTDGARLPAWKQTGSLVAFFTADRLKLLSVSDGAVRDLGAAAAGSGATWLLDGSLLFAPDGRGPIRRLLNGETSNATRLRPGDRAHTFPIAVDASDSFIYVAALEDGRRMVRLVEGDPSTALGAGPDRDLVTTSGHAQLVGDTLLHVRDGVLLAQRLDPDTRQPAGNSTPLVLEVGTGLSGHSFFAASRRLVMAAPMAKRLRQLTWFSFGSGEGTPTREPGDYWQVRLSPDDRYAAVTQTTPLLRTLDVVVTPMAETGDVKPVTRAAAADADPVWSPDGRTLVFRSLQDGPPHLYSRDAHDQDAADQLVPLSTTDETPTDWRGDRILVRAPGATGDLDLWSVHSRTGAREMAIGSPFNETDARWSADGRWVAYVSDESGQPDIYASPWPRGARVRVSFAGGTKPRWSRDGRALYFLRADHIMRADLVAPSTFATARDVRRVPGVRDFDMAHRSDRLIALMPGIATTTPSAASIIVDWRSGLP